MIELFICIPMSYSTGKKVWFKSKLRKNYQWKIQEEKLKGKKLIILLDIPSYGEQKQYKWSEKYIT